MHPSYYICRIHRLVALAFALIVAPALAQEPKTGFYDVQMTKDDIFSYTNLKFRGDYTSFESPSGTIALGRTEAGVTLVIILGQGTVTIEGTDAAQEKIKEVFGSYPAKTTFKDVYIRISPKEYDETFGKLTMSKAPSDDALAKAKDLYDQRFMASYHAGARAILPPYKTRVFEFDTPDIGQITNEEGYWLRLIRVSPYGKVYASNYVNPKQKYGGLTGKDSIMMAADYFRSIGSGVAIDSDVPGVDLRLARGLE